MTPLFGHDEAVTDFRAVLDSGRLHHAWLISGPEGIGKTLFAEKAALYYLAQGAGPPVDTQGLDVPDDHRVAKLFEAGSHPDFVRLERLPASQEDRDKPRSEWLGSATLARGIKVDQVRSILRVLGNQPAFSPRRAVVVEPADVLEQSAAHALLKSLEEPPAGTLFLLVSHQPAGLFPTIRSRCRMLRLAPLKRDAMTSALRSALPDADEDEIQSLVEAGEGAPGRAMAYRGLDIAGLDRAMRQLARDGDPTNAGRAALAQSLALKSAQPRYEAFLTRAPALIAAMARERRGAALGEAVALWERASNLASTARRQSLDPQSIVFEVAGLIAALAPTRGKQAA